MSKLPVVVPNIEIDMKISKKELMDMMVEEHELGIEEEIEVLAEQIRQYTDNTKFKDEKALILKEVKNKKEVKDLIVAYKAVDKIGLNKKNNCRSTRESYVEIYNSTCGRTDPSIEVYIAEIYHRFVTNGGYYKLEKFSPTAVKLLKQLEKQLKDRKIANDLLVVKQKELRAFKKQGKRFKHQMLKQLLGQSKQGKEILNQMEIAKSKVKKVLGC